MTERLMDYLEIRNADDRRIDITQVHAFELQEYLRALDLIVEYDVRTIVPNAEPLKSTVFAQPGMRYCQAKALVEALLRDAQVNLAPERERALVRERILEEVRGRMLEEIVLLDTLRAKRAGEHVSRLRFARAAVVFSTGGLMARLTALSTAMWRRFCAGWGERGEADL